MSDRVSEEKRSEIMSSVGSEDTEPEVAIRKELHSRGYRYSLHKKELTGSPDICLKKYRTTIFVNGCFWHGHEGCRDGQLPKSNVEFWKNKIEKNRKRDKKSIEELLDQGWRVIVLWSCTLKSSNLGLPKVVDDIEDFLEGEQTFREIP